MPEGSDAARLLPGEGSGAAPHPVRTFGAGTKRQVSTTSGHVPDASGPLSRSVAADRVADLAVQQARLPGCRDTWISTKSSPTRTFDRLTRRSAQRLKGGPYGSGVIAFTRMPYRGAAHPTRGHGPVVRQERDRSALETLGSLLCAAPMIEDPVRGRAAYQRPYPALAPSPPALGRHGRPDDLRPTGSGRCACG